MFEVSGDLASPGEGAVPQGVLDGEIELQAFSSGPEAYQHQHHQRRLGSQAAHGSGKVLWLLSVLGLPEESRAACACVRSARVQRAAPRLRSRLAARPFGRPTGASGMGPELEATVLYGAVGGLPLPVAPAGIQRGWGWTP